MNFSATPLLLAGNEPPKLALDKSLGMVTFGKNHSFWATLMKLTDASPTQSSVTATRAALVAGQGFTTPAGAVLKAFLDSKLFVNGRPSGKRFLQATARDLAQFNGFCWQVIWSRGGEEIAELHYTRWSTMASAEQNEDGEVTQYFLCKDFSNQRKNPPVPIAAFNPATATASEPQLLVSFVQTSSNDYYPLPSYASALDHIDAEGKLARFYRNQVAQRFSPSTVLTAPVPKPEVLDNGDVLSTEFQQRRFVSQLKEAFVGEDGQALMVLFGDDPENMVKVQNIATPNTGELFAQYNAQCREQILAANRVPSPAVVGIPAGASLSGEANTIRAGFQMLMATVCRPDQVLILDAMRDVLAHVSGASPEQLQDLEIVTVLPVAEQQLTASPQGQAQLDALLALSIPRAFKVARLKLFWGLTEAEAETLVPPDPVVAPPSTLPAAA